MFVPWLGFAPWPAQLWADGRGTDGYWPEIPARRGSSFLWALPLSLLVEVERGSPRRVDPDPPVDVSVTRHVEPFMCST